MRNALLFDDTLQLTEFVRIYGTGTTSSRLFTLYTIQNPDQKSRSLLILHGFRRRKTLSHPLFFQPIQIEEKKEQFFIKHPQKTRQQVVLQQKRTASSLLGLLSLSPWREEPTIPRLLFWLRNPALMPRLVGDSFRLGNDRILYAPITQNDQEHILVNIEKPSYYLLQWCQEEHPEEIDVFYSPAHHLFVEWGYQHPLEEQWKQASPPNTSPWRFFRHDALREDLTPPTWQDIYKATDFHLDFPIQNTWTEPPEHAIRFPLSLRFEPRTRPLVPEVWMLQEQEQHRLERLLSLIDEQDLDTLLISIQQDGKKQKRFFLREKHKGKGRKYFDFEGRTFASDKGFHNLLLPTAFELQPQLRREQYRNVFQLKEGELTLVDVQDTKPTNATFFRIKESSFEPISHLIDYIIASASEPLTKVMNQSLFDFGHYALSPSRPDLLHKPAFKQSSKQDSSQTVTNQEDPVPSATKRPSKEKTLQTKTSRKSTEIDERTTEPVETTQWEQEEARLERQIITKGQSAELWEQLMVLKGVMQKWEDAITSAFERLWLLPHKEDTEQVRQNLLILLDQKAGLSGTPSQRLEQAQQRAKSESKQQLTLLASYLFHGQDEAETNRAHWLQQATYLLRQTEHKFRKKERWLLWGEIFRYNKDTREKARVRETIIKELNEEGLTKYDIPHFIQKRLFQERWLQEETTQEGNQQSERGMVHKNLKVIEEFVLSFPLARIRKPALAILAYAYGKIGAASESKNKLKQAQEALSSQDITTQGWILLYASYTTEYFSQTESKQLQKKYKDICLQIGEESKHTLRKIQEMEASLEQRKDKAISSKNLSLENAQRLFPFDASRAEKNIRSRLDNITESYQAGELQRVGKEVSSLLQHIQQALNATKKEPNYRSLAWLLNSTINMLSKLKWGSEGQELVRVFENFAHTIPAKPSEKEGKLSHFYFILLHLALVEGLLILGSEKEAIEHLKPLLSWTFSQILVPLDYVDICSKALHSVEAAQLHSRREPLELLMEGMLFQLTLEQTGNAYDSPSFASIALKLFDQIVEVTMSKDKLTLGLYKQYADQDELLLRERIFNET